MYKDLNLTKTKTKPLESVVKFFITLSAFAAILISIAIVFTLLTEAINFFQDPEVTIREYFTATRWTPTFKNPVYGVLPLISSTLYIALIACLISFPLGLFSAIYLSEFASRRTRKVIKPIMEILAGVPTVVFGYFALNWITPNIVQRFIPGSGVFNAISAGIAVGIMIIPTIASISDDALNAVPKSLRMGSLALGSTRRITALKIMLPAALSGIIASFILGFSRAIGETMIVTIAGGQYPELNLDPRKAMYTITSSIVNVSLGDTPHGTTAYNALFALGITLFIMTFVLNIFSDYIARKYRKEYEQ
ncbi:phosphate ABC transporter permease subunit PstC [bacterium]|jgi:phosphate transport system permease protein|nr:phosphate ABC transporter permease subunit PstC [bacterium]MDA9732610.1 phosphate ABC transporter permease subunit PstC [Acidimicrobiaceae bacterium]MDA9737689.1 phosphate ABC transporter permease subunit PstC [Acidimicrobiaceae bacterium]MDA9756590.1 phosphate ABC transporter permease subunit PstC [Acidimicrobiaceae bacterium]MDC2988666.1 phosphate ABC transporter permease subunit PstC [Acidimicrobiaceae bacterium]|tara:strand:- start:9 stop:929 length:921 start_codon:yes stop_codon:yes gene_type:complete